MDSHLESVSNQEGEYASWDSSNIWTFYPNGNSVGKLQFCHLSVLGGVAVGRSNKWRNWSSIEPGLCILNFCVCLVVGNCNIRTPPHNCQVDECYHTTVVSVVQTST